MAYTPGVVPTDPADVPGFLRDELQKLSQELANKQELLRLAEINATPVKPRIGDIRLADGTNWNPASAGQGPVWFDGSSWIAFGSGTGSATQSIIVAIGAENVAVVSGTARATFRMPYAFTVTAVRAALVTAQTSGSTFTVDINESGTSILSTKLTIDNGEKTSTTAATAAVISDASLADDAEITIDVDTVGDGTAKGLKVTLIGTPV